MSDKVINLRLWRKSRRRDEKRAEADRNAAAHGMPKAVTDLASAREEKARRHLEGHRIDEDGEV